MKGNITTALFIIINLFFFVGDCSFISAQTVDWAFEETFTNAPNAPSQNLLPKTFDYVATHRIDNIGLDGNGPNGVFLQMGTDLTFPAEHGSDCGVGDVSSSLFPTHGVYTTHRSDESDPDNSFYICRDHMMSSAGHNSAYDVTSFWPKQAFDFSSGNGILEFDVDIASGHSGRHWFEILINPRNKLQIAPALDWLPADETYTEQSISFRFDDSSREIRVGFNHLNGKWAAETTDNNWKWRDRHPEDPANTNSHIRRKMRIELKSMNQVSWNIQKADGTFDPQDALILQVPLPTSRGLVMFKTHSYTPEKEGNTSKYTFHWDNIRFNGPKLPPYKSYEYHGLIDMRHKNPGSVTTTHLTIDSLGKNPVVVGQLLEYKFRQPKLRINDTYEIVLQPHTSKLYPYDFDEDKVRQYPNFTSDHTNKCYHAYSTTFYIPIDAGVLKSGDNKLDWLVGPEDHTTGCAYDPSYPPNGFAVKAFEIQFDGDGTTTPSVTSIIKSGDANNDSQVDGVDYLTWLTHYNQTTINANKDGDFNNSGKVDGADYVIWLSNYEK
jgi:hypothetical protein